MQKNMYSACCPKLKEMAAHRLIVWENVQYRARSRVKPVLLSCQRCASNFRMADKQLNPVHPP